MVSRGEMEKDSKSQRTALSLRSFYLIVYNAVCASLWVAIFGNVATTILYEGFPEVYPNIKNVVLMTQSLAAMEILHSLIGTAP